MNSPDRWRRLASIGLHVRRRLRGPMHAGQDDHGEHEARRRPRRRTTTVARRRRRHREPTSSTAQPTAPRGRKTKTKKASQIASSTATVSPASATAPRGPPATIFCMSSSSPRSATFSGRNAAETWLLHVRPGSDRSDIGLEVLARTLEHRRRSTCATADRPPRPACAARCRHGR